MFRLKLLGAPCIVGADHLVVSGGAAQRHRLALLALLALAPEPGIRRDKLLAYLWPERDAQHGRSLLKQTVYVLRGALGPGAIRTAADGIRLDPDVIQVDVREFRAALARGDYLAAVRLYGGPFLDGFYLSEAPDFEGWVERERERLTDAWGDALEALAGAAEAERDFLGAVATWKARAERDPYDSRVALRLIHALEKCGNRAGALLYAQSHARLLQEDVGVDPPPEVTALTDRLRQQARHRGGGEPRSSHRR